MIKLDYTLSSPEERKQLIQQILAENPSPTPAQLEAFADYMVLAMEKEERKERKILTDNRLTTVNKRETSFEGLASQFENGEDGIYSLITENKNVIFRPKISITERDLEEIPFLRQLRTSIEYWEKKLKSASGRDAYIIKSTLIELRKDQYIIKNAYRQPIQTQNLTRTKMPTRLPEEITVDADGIIHAEGVSLINPVVCSTILCNYSKLKQDSHANFEGDVWYLMYDFDKICERALEHYPLYRRIVEYKIDGKQNADIQQLLFGEFGIKHSPEYISTLWRKKIPGLIAETAEEDYLQWYYTQVERGKYKRCSRCGQIKLAHNKYFSKNKTSKDGFYSICKQCRNAK